MRPSNKSRPRNKTGNNGGHNNNQRRNSMGNILNRVFESAGPDGKVRGTPQQIIDKYQALARDAQVAGDRVAAESYLQHSEHYSRLLGEAQRAQQEARASQERDGDREDGGFEPRRQPQAQPHMASGLTTIDTDDGFDSGPIETPEGRRSGFEDSGFSRRDREQRMNGTPHAGRPAAPSPAPEAAVPQPVSAPAPQPAAPAPTASEPAAPVAEQAASEQVASGLAAAEQAAEAAPTPAEKPAAERPRRRAAREATAEPQAAPQQGEIELAEPQAEPVKKPRTRRRKTQPAATAEDAAPAAQPEPAVSGD